MRGTNIDLKKLQAALERVLQFEGKSVAVGWAEGVAYEDGTPVAYVAAIQEYGAPARRIRARPFMRPTKKKHGKKWARALAAGAVAVAKGEITGDAVLDQIGLVAAGDLQAQIEETNSPKLRPVTLLLRKWRREGRTITGKTVGEAAAFLRKRKKGGNKAVLEGVPNTPLRDTGRMVATIAHQVESA